MGPYMGPMTEESKCNGIPCNYNGQNWLTHPFNYHDCKVIESVAWSFRMFHHGFIWESAVVIGVMAIHSDM